VISSLFFLSYSSIAFVVLVEFESKGFEHLCSCHCIDLSSPRRFGGENSLSLLLLGCWNRRQLSGLVEFLGTSN
jgi:hypothetical protein